MKSLKEYGYGTFKFDGEVYSIAPTFSNIAAIGTPKEIIHCVKLLDNPHTCYYVALRILQACCDKELPEFAINEPLPDLTPTGEMISFASTDNEDHVSFVIGVARHCIKHGICGAVELDSSEDKTEEIDEFDAYKFIESAMIMFNIKRDEAANMTMTEYIRLAKIKYPELNKKDDKPKFTKAELDYFDSF